MSLLRVRKVSLSGVGVRDPRTNNLETHFDIESGPIGGYPQTDENRTERLDIAFDTETGLLYFRGANKRASGWEVNPDIRFCSASLATEGVLLDPPTFPWDKPKTAPLPPGKP